MLNTVEAVVEALGGTTATASAVGVGASAVSNWLDRGKIAPDKFLLVREALLVLGKDVDPCVFAFKAAEARA
jgi:hypothetical protein